jgi:RimJ/RimL family protein N-acetyltransferase
VRVVAAGREELGWLFERAGCSLTPRAKAIKAVDASGRIVGMVAYDNWTKNSAEAHMAADSPIAWRKMLWPAFSYPFEQEGLGVLWAVVPQSNSRSQRLTRRLGFNETHRVADGWAKGDDLVLFEMRKEHCRWLSRQHGEM